MADVVILHEGEQPEDLANFVLVEPIPAPQGASRYRVVAQGITDDGPAGTLETVDSLELARRWAEEIGQTWQSRPPVYLRHSLEQR
jgi:hypothetical protein